MDLPLIEIRDWGRRPRRLALRGPIVVGRDCAGEVLLDQEVSREHLRMVPSPTALSVVDLDSRNGTTLNGVPLTGRAALSPGDVLRLGRSEIIVLSTPTVRTAEPTAPEPDHDATRLGITIASPRHHRLRRPTPNHRAPSRLPNEYLGSTPPASENCFPPTPTCRPRSR